MYENRISRAADVLRSGGIVACPTDTVYALAADCRNASAVAKVYAAKGRPANAPLPLLVHNIEQVEMVASTLPHHARVLMERFWPGPLTVVLDGQSWLPAPLLQDGKVGVRLPDDPICLRLIERVGAPVTGTSANITGGRPAISAEHAERQMGRTVDYYLDAGRSGGAQPSTVIRFSGDNFEVLRTGPIPENDLRQALADAACNPQ